MFEKTLLDLVKGIRAHKDNEAQFISDCIRECKDELGTSDLDLKAEALNKLTFMHMLGYDMSWAAFWMIEGMALPWFGHKRVAFLAASQSFTPETEVTLLSVHLFKKAFTLGASASIQNSASTEGSQYEVGCALNCLANICNPELAQELLSDLYGMMNSTRSYIRKKAVLVLFKVFQHWPKALRLSFPRLKEKLEDEDHSLGHLNFVHICRLNSGFACTGVVSGAVNVICELARKNPKNYLSLAPSLYKLLTTSSNNWMLIKIVKLLGTLVPEEPRLAKKLVEPLTHLISTTPAKSLLYECIMTVVAGETTSKSLVQLCLEKLRLFIEDPDQNLKYLGLLGLNTMMQKEPRVVSEYKDIVLQCLKDEDVSIRMRALDLLNGMVSVRNLQDIVHRLMDHVELSEGQVEYMYRETVFARIIKMCSQDNYVFTQDFHWYTSILIDLTHVSRVSSDNAKLLADQFMDVVIRVPAVRPFAVKSLTTLLLENRLLSPNLGSSDFHMTEVLFAAAYLVGEYSKFCPSVPALILALVQPCVASLPAHVQACFLHTAQKLCASAWRNILPPGERKLFDSVSQASASVDVAEEPTEEEEESPDAMQELPVESWQATMSMCMSSLLSASDSFCSSSHLEVQERAVSLCFVGKWLSTQINLANALATASVDSLLDASVSSQASNADADPIPRLRGLASEFSLCFSGALNPVHPKAQSKVPVPKGLDLDVWINAPEPEPETEDDSTAEFDFLAADDKKASKKAASEREKAAAAARSRRQHDPFYIQDNHRQSSASQPDSAGDADNTEASNPNAAAADISSRAGRSRFQHSSRHSSNTGVSGGGGGSSSKPKKSFVVQSVIDAPDDFNVDDDEKKSSKKSSKSRSSAAGVDTLADIDVATPLRPDEIIPKSKSYSSSYAQQAATSAKESSKSSDRDKHRSRSKSDKESEPRESHRSREHRSSKVHSETDRSSRHGRTERTSDSKQSGDAVAPADASFDLLLSATPAAPAKQAGIETSSSAAFRGKGLLCSNEMLRVTYEVRPSSGHSNALVVALTVASSSSCPPLSNVSMHFSISALPHIKVADSSANLSLPSSSGASVSSTFNVSSSLTPGSHARLKLYIVSSLLQENLIVPFKLYASVEKSDKLRLLGSLPLPCALWLVGEKISTDDFRDILSDPAKSCTFLRSTSITLARLSVKEALEAICLYTGVKLVEAINFTATFYARTLDSKGHVCFLVKAARDSNTLSIDVKCSNQALSDALIAVLAANLQ